MSYILRNITRGDLSLTNTLHIKHNGYTKVEEVTEVMRDEERRGVIRISEEVVAEVVEKPVVEVLPDPVIEQPVVEPVVEVPEPIVEPIIDTVEESVISTEEVVEPIVEVEEVEEKEVANNSPKSFNNKNDYKNKFRK